MKIKQIKPGDIIKTDAGIRLVIYVYTDKIAVRPLDLGMDDAYSIDRPPAGGAWTLLARGTWRCEPDAGWEHVQ